MCHEALHAWQPTPPPSRHQNGGRKITQKMNGHYRCAELRLRVHSLPVTTHAKTAFDCCLAPSVKRPNPKRKARRAHHPHPRQAPARPMRQRTHDRPPRSHPALQLHHMPHIPSHSFTDAATKFERAWAAGAALGRVANHTGSAFGERLPPPDLSTSKSLPLPHRGRQIGRSVEPEKSAHRLHPRDQNWCRFLAPFLAPRWSSLGGAKW